MKSLRRGFGYRSAGKVPAQVLQKAMRHANIKTTLDYDANVDEAAEEVILGPNGTGHSTVSLPSQARTAAMSTQPMNLERLSIELTNACAKACWFCYNHSQPAGATRWTSDEVVAFVGDCAAHGVRAVSFGGGEPLQYDGLFDVLARLEGVLFRSLTSNGLLLHGDRLDRLVGARPDKVHLSIHFPHHAGEVDRVVGQVQDLQRRGVRSGINLLVARSNLEAAARAAGYVRSCGIGNERIVYLPMRGTDTPTPQEVARVAGNGPFQSMSCLAGCAKSPRFCSIGWDQSVAWCSYTSARVPLRELSHAGLLAALDGLGLIFCGGTDGT
jgi:sulfatase maturation enzyme AslB (radical SAM superfamily)